jgi:hypothetical protein
MPHRAGAFSRLFIVCYIGARIPLMDSLPILENRIA